MHRTKFYNLCLFLVLVVSTTGALATETLPDQRKKGEITAPSQTQPALAPVRRSSLCRILFGSRKKENPQKQSRSSSLIPHGALENGVVATEIVEFMEFESGLLNSDWFFQLLETELKKYGVLNRDDLLKSKSWSSAEFIKEPDITKSLKLIPMILDSHGHTISTSLWKEIKNGLQLDQTLSDDLQHIGIVDNTGLTLEAVRAIRQYFTSNIYREEEFIDAIYLSLGKGTFIVRDKIANRMELDKNSTMLWLTSSSLAGSAIGLYLANLIGITSPSIMSYLFGGFSILLAGSLSYREPHLYRTSKIYVRMLRERFFKQYRELRRMKDITPGTPSLASSGQPMIEGSAVEVERSKKPHSKIPAHRPLEFVSSSEIIQELEALQPTPFDIDSDKLITDLREANKDIDRLWNLTSSSYTRDVVKWEEIASHYKRRINEGFVGTSPDLDGLRHHSLSYQEALNRLTENIEIYERSVSAIQSVLDQNVKALEAIQVEVRARMGELPQTSDDPGAFTARNRLERLLRTAETASEKLKFLKEANLKSVSQALVNTFDTVEQEYNNLTDLHQLVTSALLKNGVDAAARQALQPLVFELVRRKVVEESLDADD